MLVRILATASLLIALPLLAVPGKEERCHFEVTLEVKTASSRQESRRAVPDLQGLLPKRPLLRLSAGEEVTLSWTVLALPGSYGAFKDLTIHSYLVSEKEAGQDRPPSLAAGATLESALLMDFAPGDTAKGTFKVLLDEPGDYLVQVETLGVSASEAHEHSAQIDLRVTARGDGAPGRKESK